MEGSGPALALLYKYAKIGFYPIGESCARSGLSNERYRMTFLNLHHPFFRPLLARILTVGVTGGWAAVEFISGSPGWAAMFGAVAAWCGYQFFIVFDPDNYKGTPK
jgi:hypothetical protein